MIEARSIKQNSLPDALPNFRNLGVTLRILLLTNGMGFLASVMQARSWPNVLVQMLQISTLMTPIVLGILLVLWLVQASLFRIAYWRGVAAVNAIAGAVALLTYYLGGEFYQPVIESDYYFDVLRCVLLSVAMCSLMLMYFRLRMRILSHALEDAYLQVLRARIRPHFLFNTINAVLGIVRAEPKKAETALEDMADLFRMAMSEAKDLVPVHQEVALSKQYIALEKLRMGERLCVEWQVQDIPDDALMPVLLLQPLLENAVYHGIETLVEGGVIHVKLRREGAELRIEVENPCPVASGDHHVGNKIALKNIRERLALLFDAEARYQVSSGKGYYRVEIIMPYVREKRREHNRIGYARIHR
ncbi:MAG: histidine kinase [Gallionella sp.]|nr:histidine kinase [Gallionella sp.]MDD4945553.1 histidine kinase [Gallionella sp.]MDD5612198.1 histidine kinase [Gallionella sp.]